MLVFPLLLTSHLEDVPSQQGKVLICPLSLLLIVLTHFLSMWVRYQKIMKICWSKLWSSNHISDLGEDELNTPFKRHLPSLKRALMRSFSNQLLTNTIINIFDKMACMKVHLFQQQKQNQTKILIKIWRRGLSWSSIQWKITFLKTKLSLDVTLHYVVNEPFHFPVHSNIFNLSCIF